jgi:hypothetical protein
MIVSIEKRLGVLIGVKRRERLLEGELEYKQENFILCDERHPFEGCAKGRAVCSLATLSRLENGKHDNNHALLDFFLKKLGIIYRIRESVYQQENHVLNRIAFGFSSVPMDQFNTELEALKLFFMNNQDDPLIGLDVLAHRFISRVMLNQSVTLHEYNSLMKTHGIVHPLISQWLKGCGMLLKQTHPDFWDLKVETDGYIFTEAVKTVKNLRRISDLDNDLVQALYQRFHPKSMAEKILEKLIRSLHGEIGGTPEEAMTESELCLMILRNGSLKRKGQSVLAIALAHYREIREQRDKLDFLRDEILPLLSMEPTPRRISIALSDDVLSLCQTLKTYKPLVALVTLLSENNV